jgi:hypothetical protein
MTAVYLWLPEFEKECSVAPRAIVKKTYTLHTVLPQEAKQAEITLANDQLDAQTF